jgi:capsular polysaccharide biosynthesis protein
MPEASGIVFPRHASRGRRVFENFGHNRIAAHLRGFAERVLAAPAISQVENARFAPVERYKKGFFTGGVYGAAGYMGELALHRGFAANRTAHVSAAADAPEMTSEILPVAWFGGYLFDHYGHFILEGLARVQNPAIRQSSDPIVFFDMMRIRYLRSYMADAFSHCGIDPARIHLCNAPLTVESLRIVEPSFEVRGFVRPSAYRDLSVADADRSGVVYLSRSRLDRVRKIEGEEELERHLERSFEARIVYPEAISFKLQLQTLASAACVIGCEGSAFHTFIFQREAPLAIILDNSLPHVDYLLCDEVFDGETVYIRAAKETAEGRNRGHWTIDVPAALRIIEKRMKERGAPQAVLSPVGETNLT